MIFSSCKGLSGLPFADVLTEDDIKDVLDSHSVKYRKRVWTPWITLWSFLSQMVDEDHSCQNVVNRFAAYRASKRLPDVSTRNGAYVAARQRMPEEIIRDLIPLTCKRLESHTPADWKWNGRSVKIVDGTMISMPDTAENQSEYPQHKTQAKGLGFPAARVSAIVSLSTGMVLDVAIGSNEGKGTGESALFRSLWHQLDPGDIVLADRYYDTYWMLAGLKMRGVDAVIRMTDRRKFHSGIVTLKKPAKCPAWMSRLDYNAYPAWIQVKVIKIAKVKGVGRVSELSLITTLTSASDQELLELYRERWHVETDFRTLKEIMGMEILRTKTPEMIRKEIYALVLAYNCICLIRAQAAKVHNKKPRKLSYTVTLRAVEAYEPYLSMKFDMDVYLKMLEHIARHEVGRQKNRWNPRVVKRRPKQRVFMMKPRADYKPGD